MSFQMAFQKSWALVPPCDCREQERGISTEIESQTAAGLILTLFPNCHNNDTYSSSSAYYRKWGFSISPLLQCLFFHTGFRKNKKKKRTRWCILKGRGKKKFLKALTQTAVKYEKISKSNASPDLSKTVANVYGCLQQTLYLKDSSIHPVREYVSLIKEIWAKKGELLTPVQKVLWPEDTAQQPCVFI